MKKVLLALTALAALTGSAVAADLPARTYSKAPPPMVAPVATWTGCYVNGGGGYVMSNENHYAFFSEDPTRTPATDTSTTGGQGWLGRVGVGCDYQFAGFAGYNVVVGAFGDYDFGGAKGTFEGSVPLFTFAPPFGTATVLGNEKQRYAWAAGVRAGILVTPALLTYINGGYTETRLGQVDLNVNSGGGPLGSSLAATTFHGWFLGSGTEYTILSIPGLFWRNEYRFSRFAGADRTGISTATGVPLTGPFALSEHSKLDTQSVTTSLVYKFNWWR